MAKDSFSTAERFWAKVRKTDGCWLWQGSLRSGYGRFRGGAGPLVTAHRYAYRLLVGPIPEGLVLDHLCRNGACVNPAHLEPVTQRENLRRGTGFNATNAAKTHCPAGHPYSEANTYRWRDARICLACHAEGRKRRRDYG
jgi:hypothetical protein